MPNWVKTIVKTKPDVLKDILEKYSTKEGFSFNNVIPMPKELDIDKSSSGDDGLMYLYLESNDEKTKNKINEVYRSTKPFDWDIFNEIKFQKLAKNYDKNKIEDKTWYKESIELAKKYISNYEKYGYVDWYDWRCANWGTKWDLSQLDYNKDTMIFETAWGFAGKVILELSRKYPEAVFECIFADEGIQENSGILKIKDGEIMSERYNLSQSSIDAIWLCYLDDSEQEIEPEEEETEIEIDC